MEDYYRLFPDCERCQQYIALCNMATTICQEEVAEGQYAAHLLDDHGLTTEEIVRRTGTLLM